MAVLRLVLVWLAVSVVTVRATKDDCLIRQFPDASSFVCECSAAHCDGIEDYALNDGNFVVFTSSKRGLRLEKEEIGIMNRPNNLAGPGVTLTVNRSREYQTILGFGGSFTDAAALNLYNLSSAAQENLMRAYFGSEGLEYTFGRIPMASCDFSTHEYSYADTPSDFKLDTFALQEEDIVYKIPMIQRAVAMSNRKLHLIGSPWSAPGWMKTNGKMQGGARLWGSPGDQYYKTWALYFAKFVEEYQANGVDIWGLTGQNEPTAGIFPNWAWQSMYFSPILQRDFIKYDLGPTLHARGHEDVKLIILDDQRFLLPYWARVVLDDEDAASYVSGIGLHWYWDKLSDAERLSQTHEEYPDYFMIGTEACEGHQDWEQEVILGSWERGEEYSHDIIEDLSNWVAGWIDWNLALDLIGGPNWVGNFVDSPIIVDAKRDVFYKQPMYYHLGHFSKFIVPDAVRVGLESSNDKLLENLAFKLPDGSMALVVLNRKEFAFPLHINDPDVGYLNAEVPARSIQTYLWKSATQ